MKKIYSSIFIALLPFGLIAQTILYHANFGNYKLGKLSGQNGWSNNTSDTGGLGSCVGILCTNNSVVKTPLSFPNYGSSAQSVALVSNQDGPGTAITPTFSGNIYVYLLCSITTAPAKESDLIRIMAGSNYSTAARIYIKDNGGSFVVGVGKGANSGSYNGNGPNGLAYGTSHLLVLKYAFASGLDKVSVYVDPDMSMPEPAIPEISSTSGSGASQAIDRLVFPYSLNSKPEGFVGDVFVADVWNSVTTLPVSSIKNFQLSKQNNLSATLKWSIVGSNTVSKIQVQQSNNGFNYTSVGNIQLTGDGLYSYNSPIANDVTYFRLAVTNNDGRTYYTNALLTKKGVAETKLSVYPNPATNIITIKTLQNMASEATITIIDMFGKQLESKNISVDKGENTISYNVSHLPKGLYLLKLSANNNTAQTERIVKF